MGEKIEKYLIFIVITIVIFVFSINLSFAQNNIVNNNEIDRILKNNITSKSIEVNNENIDKKLLEVANIKLEVADEKEAAYDKAINQLKLYMTFFGSLLILIAMAFGFYKDKKIVEANDELWKLIEEKKKSLEDSNAVNLEKTMMGLEKVANIKIDEIKELTFSDIKDLRERIKSLESSDKTNSEDNDMKKNNKKEISFEDKNPYE